MLSLGATWISDQPRYSWRAFLLLMIAALLLLTNIFTQRFMAQDGTHMQEADVDKKGYKSISPSKFYTMLYLRFMLCTGFIDCKDTDSQNTHLTAFQVTVRDTANVNVVFRQPSGA